MLRLPEIIPHAQRWDTTHLRPALPLLSTSAGGSMLVDSARFAMCPNVQQLRVWGLEGFTRGIKLLSRAQTSSFYYISLYVFPRSDARTSCSSATTWAIPSPASVPMPPSCVAGRGQT